MPTKLTKNDLAQITAIVSEVVEGKLKPVKTSIEKLDKRIRKQHKELKKELKLVSHVLDKQNMQTLKRVKRIGDHLGLAA